VHYKPLLLDLKVFLQGPYSAGTMNIALKTGGYLASHFGTMPIPGWAVDSINLEIRDAASSPTIRKFRTAWLMQNGSVRMFNDTMVTHVEFDTATAGSYYIVVRHRNHLAIMSASAQALSASSALYDFTTGLGQCYGGDAKQLASGVYGLYAGDATGNGQVQLDDLNDNLRPAIGQSGYKASDLNLDGQVQNSDMNDYLRPNIGKGTRVP
jgi:hypothetical protein